MMLTKILFFLVFTFCYCETVNLYEILSKQVKDIQVKVPPREEYQKILLHIGKTRTRVFQNIFSSGDLSIIHTKNGLPKEFTELINKTLLAEKEPRIIGLKFIKKLDELTYSEIVGAVYKAKDRIYLTCAEVQIFALPIPIKNGVEVKECRRVAFFKKCKKLFIETIQGFNEKQLNIFEQTVKAYGYIELTRIIESNKGLNIQLLD